jgi:CheY-like chemotaxis protein
MSTEIWVELIRLVPTLLWVALVIGVVLILRTQLRARLSDLVGLKVGMSGVEATFLTQQLERAEEVAKASQGGNGDPDGGSAEAIRSEPSLVIRRAERNADALHGARILWVDDHPQNNYYERNILQSLGVKVSTALTTEEALPMIARQRFDLIITDRSRGSDPDAGITLLNALREQGSHPSIIFYASQAIRPLPDGAFGSTNRPEQLLHLVMDVLERERS